MSDVPDNSTFENLYAGQPPWDIGKPQKPFIDIADRITGSVLDAGCGTGDTSLFLAGRGITKCQACGWIGDLDAADRNLADDFLSAGVSMHVHGCDRAEGNKLLALAALYDRLHDDTRVRRFVRDVSGRSLARICLRRKCWMHKQ